MFRPTLFAIALIVSAPAFAQAGGVTTMPRAKFVSNSEADFARIDVNKDGLMSRTEIETFQRTSAAAMYSARNKAMFAQLDSDKNGQLSSAEFAKVMPEPKVDARNMLRIDTSKDGQISLAEHRAATLDVFTTIDTNKDGTITAAEAQAAAAQR